MGKTVIKFSLSPESIEKAIGKVRLYKIQMQAKAKVLTERLAEIGLKEASVRFTNAMYDGVNDSQLSLEAMPNGWKIVASGNAVAFIEFGSGVYHNPAEPYPNPRPAGVVGIGEYGLGKGKNKAWVYKGEPGTNGIVKQKKNGEQVVITRGNPAAMPMWYASEEMRREVLSLAREVFQS